MTFQKTFCSSPWLNMRINNSGTYEPCRWMTKTFSRVNFDTNINKTSPLEFFQHGMAPLRNQLLQGQSPAMCSDCKIMESHGKVSGRQRQLLKAGITEQHFEKSLASSPLRSSFDYSNLNQGRTNRTVTDWQIDLGNYCNGACVFCHPESSSTLTAEFKKLNLIDQLPARNWCDDPEMLGRFIKDLVASPDLQYLHFIGGETVITPAFKKILTALIEANLASQITIGFTTNLMSWSDSVVELLTHFTKVNLGMSVETLTSLNDYVRYPSRQSQTKEMLDRWISLGRKHDWLMQIRTTPTCLTVHELDTVYDFAWQNKISIESCNFLNHPEFLRISVLPNFQRQQASQRLKKWIDSRPAVDSNQIINTRNPNLAQTQTIQDAQSYLNYLESAEEETHRLPALVNYLKLLESNRGNRILDYIPEYEDLFRSAGY